MNITKKIKNIIIGTFFNLLKVRPNELRSEICSRCIHRVKLYGLGDCCDKCGCVIESKVRVKDEKCPIGKW